MLPRSTLLALVLLSTACSIEGPKHTEETLGARDDIVGGSPTAQLPAVGAITRYGYTHCTGTLISARRVVTAAHCLENVSASSLRFVIGASVSQAEHVLTVASVTPHPQYDSYSLDHDIGYIDLTSNAPVPPMGVLTHMDSSFVGQELVFVGYGASNGYQQTGSGTKRSVNMPVQQVWARQFRYAVPSKNTCNGDSGGPAFAQVNGQLLVAGVTSYGDANCVQYGVDTRTDVYLDFLDVSSAPEDPCGGETYEGRCDGNSVVWCENDQVQTQPCSGGKICGFSDQHQYFACIEPPTDPCQGETYEGRCDGNTVIWCENEQVKTLQCQTCGYDAQQGYYNCL